MTEIIPLNRPASPLGFTGERFTTVMPRSQIEAEHLHRYLLARSYCAGMRVLDVACGEGYGSAILAQVAQEVVGVDLDHATIEHARMSYASATNLNFAQGNALNLPFPDKYFDIIVSFETIEHLHDPVAFIREVKRLVKDDGVCFISTPDRDVYSSSGKPHNVYHVKEMDLSEFQSLMSDHFAEVITYSQISVLGSVMFRQNTCGEEPVTFERRDDDSFEVHPVKARVPYLLAFATDRVASLRAPSLSLLREFEEYGFVACDGLRAASTEQTLRAEIARLEEALRRLERTARDRAGAIEHLEGVVGKISALMLDGGP